MLSRSAAASRGARPRRPLAIPPPGTAAGRVGPWQLDEVLGPGTFAGTEAATGAPVVVKVAVADDPAAARLRREAAALRSLGGGDHPALVAAAGAYDEGGLVAVATRRVDGTPLDVLLRDRGPLPFADVARLLAPVADAVAGLHRRGWVHGDISPANVVVGADGAVLVDLGAAHPSATPPTDVEATPTTAAPEVLRGQHGTTPTGDVWALAALVAVAVTGEPPTYGSPLPAPVAIGLRRALADDPGDRPSASELTAALVAVGRDGAAAPVLSTARACPREERATRDFGPRPSRVAVAPIGGPRRWWPALVALLGVAAALGWRLGAPGPPPVTPPPVTVSCPAVAPLAGGRLRADVDGDGCMDAAGWRDGVLTVRTAAARPLRRYVLGVVGASVTLGDWDADGIATPAVTDPTTGIVTRYEAWP